MQRVKLDRIDRRILADPQANGRITNVELSKRARGGDLSGGEGRFSRYNA